MSVNNLYLCSFRSAANLSSFSCNDLNFSSRSVLLTWIVITRPEELEDDDLRDRLPIQADPGGEAGNWTIESERCKSPGPGEFPELCLDRTSCPEPCLDRTTSCPEFFLDRGSTSKLFFRPFPELFLDRGSGLPDKFLERMSVGFPELFLERSVFSGAGIL
jgi:hypothetical protein